MCLGISLMYDGCLRWGDIQQLKYGDIVISTQYFRLFIESAKTDAYRQGQWVTIAISESPSSSFSLLMQVLEAITIFGHSRQWRCVDAC